MKSFFEKIRNFFSIVWINIKSFFLKFGSSIKKVIVNFKLRIKTFFEKIILQWSGPVPPIAPDSRPEALRAANPAHEGWGAQNAARIVPGIFRPSSGRRRYGTRSPAHQVCPEAA